MTGRKLRCPALKSDMIIYPPTSTPFISGLLHERHTTSCTGTEHWQKLEIIAFFNSTSSITLLYMDILLCFIAYLFIINPITSVLLIGLFQTEMEKSTCSYLVTLSIQFQNSHPASVSFWLPALTSFLPFQYQLFS